MATSSRRAKDLFGDCALVEIIHLHDCFRGALRALELDVTELCKEISTDSSDATSSSPSSTARTSSAVAAHLASIEGTKYSDKIIDLERRVAGRFTVIWSVFRAHSAAEDEFIWPALKAKQVSLPASPCHSPRGDGVINDSSNAEDLQIVHQRQGPAAGAEGDEEEAPPEQRERQNSIVHHIEQEEYEEDHADEERMFNAINELLSTLRVELQKGMARDNTLQQAANMLLEGTKKLMHHLLTHLDKEETHCMPLVAQYLTKHEINDLVGKIMVSLLFGLDSATLIFILPSSVMHYSIKRGKDHPN